MRTQGEIKKAMEKNRLKWAQTYRSVRLAVRLLDRLDRQAKQLRKQLLTARARDREYKQRYPFEPGTNGGSLGTSETSQSDQRR